MKQKEEERLIIQYFRKNYPGFPKGRLIPSEAPDFILKISPKRSIGIELTRLFGTVDLIAAIRSAIDKKEEKLKSYQNRHLFELWLIIYAEDAFKDVSFNVANKINNLDVITNFNQVFMFDLLKGEVNCLKC